MSQPERLIFSPALPRWHAGHGGFVRPMSAPRKGMHSWRQAFEAASSALKAVSACHLGGNTRSKFLQRHSSAI
jgi:hypothetical protein